jgi:uncharacterized DUF497 family protein
MKNFLKNCEAFEWDEGNIDKNWIRHRVSRWECEEIFFNKPLIIAEDRKHSQNEPRYYALGRTDQNRFLFVAFAIRQKLIRIISASDANKKESKKYEERVKRYTKIQK